MMIGQYDHHHHHHHHVSTPIDSQAGSRCENNETRIVDMDRHERARREESSSIVCHQDQRRNQTASSASKRTFQAFALPSLDDASCSDATDRNGAANGRKRPFLARRPRSCPGSLGLELLGPGYSHASSSVYATPPYQQKYAAAARQQPQELPSIAMSDFAATRRPQVVQPKLPVAGPVLPLGEDTIDLPKITLKRRPGDGSLAMMREEHRRSSSLDDAWKAPNSNIYLPLFPSDLPDDIPGGGGSASSTSSGPMPTASIVSVPLIAPRPRQQQCVDSLLTFQSNALSSNLFL